MENGKWKWNWNWNLIIAVENSIFLPKFYNEAYNLVFKGHKN